MGVVLADPVREWGEESYSVVPDGKETDDEQCGANASTSIPGMKEETGEDPSAKVTARYKELSLALVDFIVLLLEVP